MCLFNLKKSILLIFKVIFLSIILNSCIVVKEEDKVRPIRAIEGTTYTLTPKPLIPMSEQYVRSEEGDMIALLPKDWILLNVDNNTNPDIFAVAVNKDYTLSAVFANIRNTSNLEDAFANDGIIGVVNYDLNRKKQKTGGSLNIMGNINFINIGPYQYANFKTTTTGGALFTHSVIFKSSLNNYFEFALVPINVMGKDLPTKKETEDVFYSFLACIKY